MRCVTGVLKRWDETNRSRNLGASPIKIQVEEDEGKRSTVNIQRRIKTAAFSVHWTLDVGRWTFSDCRLNSSNSSAIRFEHAARSHSPGSWNKRSIIRSTDIIRAVEHQLAAAEIISPA